MCSWRELRWSHFKGFREGGGSLTEGGRLGIAASATTEGATGGGTAREVETDKVVGRGGGGRTGEVDGQTGGGWERKGPWGGGSHRDGLTPSGAGEREARG